MTTDDTPLHATGQARRARLGLGSNLGDRRAMLQGAVDALGDTPGVDVVAVSPVYESAPLGGMDQPDYLNAVVVIDTTLSGELLLERAHAIEDAFGRARAERWGARTLDVDILTYAEHVSEDPELTLPHPGAHERSFVLVPWHDVEPEAEVPGRGRVRELVNSVGPAGVRRRDDLELRPSS
ncbi:MAG: 2-amino-4-hydroxy-6-hydroxymethyldihydropteridine diphosphokinase [Streptosporangiaceae bacterium]